MTPCIVCERLVDRNAMCRPCRENYDRKAHSDGSVLEAMEWAAKRARWFAKRKARP